MGFRSTICSQHYSGELPKWFKDKYNDLVSFPDGLLVVSIKDSKRYSNEFFEDYQKAVKESGFWNQSNIEISIAVLAECGFISKVVVTDSEVRYYWVDDFTDGDGIWNRE